MRRPTCRSTPARPADPIECPPLDVRAAWHRLLLAVVTLLALLAMTRWLGSTRQQPPVTTPEGNLAGALFTISPAAFPLHAAAWARTQRSFRTARTRPPMVVREC